MGKSTPPGSWTGMSREVWPACREPRHAQNQLEHTMKGVLLFVRVRMLTCQNGPELCTWGDVTATAINERSLKVIQTHTRQLWGHMCYVIKSVCTQPAIDLTFIFFCGSVLFATDIRFVCVVLCFFCLGTGVGRPERCLVGDVWRGAAE